MPIEVPTIQVDKFYLENISKINEKSNNSKKLNEIMDEIGTEANKNGLTEQLLNDILKKPALPSFILLIPILCLAL